MSGVGSEIDRDNRSPSPSPSKRPRFEQTDSEPFRDLEKDARPEHQRSDVQNGGVFDQSSQETEGPPPASGDHNMADTDDVTRSKADDVRVYDSFDDMNLREALVRGIYAYGFEKPSAIQRRAIIPCIMGRDVVVQAGSGAGVTATCCVAVLQRIDPSVTRCQALLLLPTREHAMGLQSVIKSLGSFMRAECQTCVGGTAIRESVQKLKAGVHIVVGTPGRVSDMINRRALDLSELKMFVLHDADEVFYRGFKEQIHDIIQNLPAEIQVILLSATMTSEVLEVIQRVMRDPVHITQDHCL